MMMMRAAGRRAAAAAASAAAAAAPASSSATNTSTSQLPGASVARQISRQIADREKTAVQVANEWLARVRLAEPHVQAFLAVTEQQALERAAAIDAALARGAAAGALTGVPAAFKDNLCTRGVATTAGSRVLEGYLPPYDATTVARLLAGGAADPSSSSSSSSSSHPQLGALMLGKLNLDEFGMGSTTENSAYKPTRNPWDPQRVPGGSSGGSAAAVAARQVVLALGSDTGGSIRQPASFCGVVGVKPTYGLVSRYGLVAYASSLDTVGPLAPTVEDAALALDAIAGADPNDATSVGGGGGGGGAAASSPSSSSSSSAAVFRGEGPCASAVAAMRSRMAQGHARPLAGRRVGLVRETVGQGVDASVAAAVRSAADALAALGAEVEEVSLPTFEAGLPAYYVLAVAEASSNLSRFDGVRYGLRRERPAAAGAGSPSSSSSSFTLKDMYGATRGEGLGAEVKRRILMGTYALSAGYVDAYYARAQRVRERVRAEMTGLLLAGGAGGGGGGGGGSSSTSSKRFDVLITPAAPTPAYRLGDKLSDPLAMWAGDLMTVNLNLSGLPAVVLPAGFAPAAAAAPEDGAAAAAARQLPIGVQVIGPAFGEPELLAMAAALEASMDVAGKAGPAPLAAA
jgi:aspartyl-tRNA(Asn)/glutamyl-tRNA(Gln) amidotransferase subunit A